MKNFWIKCLAEVMKVIASALLAAAGLTASGCAQFNSILL